MADLVIGLCGYKGSGKSVAAHYLCSFHGFATHSLAYPLKHMLRCGFGISDEHLWGSKKEDPLACLGGHSARHAMVTLGTEWGRTYLGEDCWIRAWKATKPDGNVVCDDVRFQNEADMIRKMGGVVVQIQRPGCGPGEHQSEVIDFDPDFIVINSGVKADLESRLFDLMQYLDGWS